MKKKALYSALFLLIILTGCKEAAESRDVIFFTGTEQSSKVDFAVEQPTDLGITVTSTTKVESNVKVDLEVGDQSLLDSYNSSTGNTYIMPPQNCYSLASNETVIKSGNHVSEAVKLLISSLDGIKEGANYCIPVVITNVDGGLTILESSKVIYIVIKRIIYQKAMKLSTCGLNVPKFMTDERVSSLEQITMEAKVRIDEFHEVEWGIASIMGIEETWLLRFADIGGVPNQLQMGPALINGKEKFFITSQSTFVTDKWYHLASVYDGQSVAIYINGKLDVKFPVAAGKVNLNVGYFDGFWIGQSCGTRYFDGTICEARFWNRALSAVELQDNMCMVDPKAEGLLACWKFNGVQEDGRILDVTGNGFDAFPKNKSYSWVENVKCPF